MHPGANPARPTLDHVTITASDLARSAAFYDAVLGTFGLTRLVELVDEEEDESAVEAVAWGDDQDAGGAEGAGLLWLVGEGRSTTGLHIRLSVQSQVEVEAFAAAAVQHGGSVHLAPRRWTPYRRGEFHAIVRDPDGNLIEARCPE